MGSRSEVGGAALWDTKQRRGMKLDYFVAPFAANSSIADNYPLAMTMPPLIVLGASAARDVLMPANDAAYDGLLLTIMSNSINTTGVLTLKTSADAALSPAVTLVQFAAKTMVYLHGIGWRQYS